MHHPIVQIVMRYIHILSAVFAVGGLGFLLFCLTPAVRMLDDGFSESWLKLIRNRFHKLLWISIGGLVISGLYNWMLYASTYKEMGAIASALIGTKVLLALLMFTTAWAGSVGMLRPKVTQMINIHLGVTIIFLAVVLRYLRLEHLQSLINGG